VTEYVGKLNGRGVFDPRDDARLLCCWDDCEKYGSTLHRVRFYEGVNPALGPCRACAGCRSGQGCRRNAIWSWKVFCTEKHKMLYVNGPKSYGRLPAGYKLTRF